MAIAVSQITSGTPLSNVGALTGAQIIKLIPAPRVFVKATPDSQTAAVVPSTKSAGLPSNLTGWTDLGIVDGVAKINYTKKTKEVTTGIDDVLRAAYVGSKHVEIDFELTQVDSTVMALISGLAASQITSGSIYTFHLGQEDLVQMAMLLVVQSKLDSKEWQFYNPLVYMNFVFTENKDAMTLKCTALLPFFTVAGQTNSEYLASSIFA